MNIITLDFETFFSDQYTLSNMTTEAYVRDPRFEVLGAAIRTPIDLLTGEPAVHTTWCDGPDLHVPLDAIDWGNTALLCHHAHFDGLILSHHYGIVPRMYLDTLSMARLVVGNHLSKGLGALAEHFGLGTKDVPYNLFKGKHWHEIDPAAREAIARGACQDVNLTWDLFNRLAATFPAGEYSFVDATVRMFTKPVLEGDTALLGEIWQCENDAKAALLEQLGVTAADLRKDWRFAELLRDRGIEPEQKRMKDDATGEARYKYAFAKTDDFMRDLADDEDDTIRLLVQAKLDAHATGTQTRVTRLGYMSTRGKMCVYLNYAGTHLSGWSGGDKVNWQNFRRGGPIATAIRAPAGHRVVVADASQIECRLLNEIAGQHDVIERFRQHEDPYVALASTFYGETVYKPKADDPRRAEMEAKRGTGKQGELSCGYGAGGPTIKATAKRGTYGPPVLMTDEEAMRLRDTYRSSHPRVVDLWRQADDVLTKMAAGLEFDWNVVHIANKTMWLPNGVPVSYATLEWHTDDSGDEFWRVRTRQQGWTKLYGAKLVENLIQALRNVFVRQAWSECMAAGLDIVTMEHDKLVGVVRGSDAEAALAFLQGAMSRPPAWLPNIPLDSEGYHSVTLAKSNG